MEAVKEKIAVRDDFDEVGCDSRRCMLDGKYCDTSID